MSVLFCPWCGTVITEELWKKNSEYCVDGWTLQCPSSKCRCRTLIYDLGITSQETIIENLDKGKV